MIFGNWRPAGLLIGAVLFGYTQALRLRSGGESRARAAARRRGGPVWRRGPASCAERRWSGRRRPLVAAALALSGGTSRPTRCPRDFTEMTPYVATLLVLALASQQLRMPAADGQIYRQGLGAADDRGRRRLGRAHRAGRRGDAPRLRAVLPLPGGRGRPGRRRPGGDGLQRRERGVRRRRCAPSAGWSPSCTSPAAAG